MKRKGHIRTRILVTLIGLSCAILLVVALAFNLSIQSYIRSRVATQLDTVSQSASRQRGDGPWGPRDMLPFDEHPDKMIGTRGNAIVLEAGGALVAVLHGEESVGRELSEYFIQQGSVEKLSYKVIKTGSGSYAVSVTDDPMEAGKFLLSYVDVTSLIALTRQVNLVLLIVILAAILLSLILSHFFSRSLAKPVQSLSGFADEIRRGNLSPRQLSFRDKEFDALADSMNRMVRDLSEEKQKQEVFFQNVSHELRTPLTAIRGNAEGIVYDVIEPKQAARVILSESEKLGGMVEDLLYFSRLGRAAAEEDVPLLDLREVLSLCVSEQRAESDKKGIAFHFDFSEEPVLLDIREQDAERLFGNLISNAIRYAKANICLSCQKNRSGIQVQVADDGPGIPPEDLPHIFERFFKGKEGRHGIGLAIAKSVAESKQGQIKAYNEGGAVFQVSFPEPAAGPSSGSDAPTGNT